MSFVSTRAWALKRTFSGILASKSLFSLAVVLAATALALPVFLGSLGWSLSSAFRGVTVASEITVFAQRSAGEATVAELARRIGRADGVESVRIIPRAEALATVNRQLGLAGGKAQIAAEANPLPDVVVARLARGTPADSIAAIAGEIRKDKGVDRVAFDDKWPRIAHALATALAIGGLILGSVVGVLVLLVITACVRLTTSAQRDEIRALHLFGATDAFIRRPYVWRGSVTMLLAAGLSLAISAAGLLLLAEPVAAFAAHYSMQVRLRSLPADWCLLYMLVAALTGAVIGSLATRDAVAQACGR
ncbi:MAG: hypothetical protein HUK26_03385 [Duodenibacillus sp.]|nr:hypothetical protein [Duodenibacillus sp.]